MMWGLMLLGAILGLWAAFRKRLQQNRWTLRFLVLAVLFPEIGNQMGWYSAEIGRQPWVVHGLLKTADAASKNISVHQVIFSLVLFSLIYALLFIMFIYLLDKKIRKGPPEEEGVEEYRDPYSIGA